MLYVVFITTYILLRCCAAHCPCESRVNTTTKSVNLLLVVQLISIYIHIYIYSNTTLTVLYWYGPRILTCPPVKDCPDLIWLIENPTSTIRREEQKVLLINRLWYDESKETHSNEFHIPSCPFIVATKYTYTYIQTTNTKKNHN